MEYHPVIFLDLFSLFNYDEIYQKFYSEVGVDLLNSEFLSDFFNQVIFPKIDINNFGKKKNPFIDLYAKNLDALLVFDFNFINSQWESAGPPFEINITQHKQFFEYLKNKIVI